MGEQEAVSSSSRGERHLRQLAKGHRLHLLLQGECSEKQCSSIGRQVQLKGNFSKATTPGAAQCCSSKLTPDYEKPSAVCQCSTACTVQALWQQSMLSLTSEAPHCPGQGNLKSHTAGVRRELQAVCSP